MKIPTTITRSLLAFFLTTIISLGCIAQKTTKPLKSYKNIDGKWIELTADQVKAIKEEKVTKESKPAHKHHEVLSEIPDTTSPQQHDFIEKIKETELVEVIAQFNAGSHIPNIVIDSTDLIALVEKINNSPKDIYVLVGHTNSMGAIIPNIKLSTDRAAATHKLLISSYFLDKEKLSLGGAGEGMPMYDNSTRENRKKNSRVEIRKVIITPD